MLLFLILPFCFDNGFVHCDIVNQSVDVIPSLPGHFYSIIK